MSGLGWGKDVERLARAFVKQKLDIEYIRHYLMEQYQLERKTVDSLLEKIGATHAADGHGKGPAKPDDKDKVKRQGFF